MYMGPPPPPEPKPHKIEEDLTAEPEWTEQDARYLQRHAAFNEFYAEHLRRKAAHDGP